MAASSTVTIQNTRQAGIIVPDCGMLSTGDNTVPKDAWTKATKNKVVEAMIARGDLRQIG